MALIFVVLNGLLAGFLAEADFFLLLFGLIGGMAAIYGSQVLRPGQANPRSPGRILHRHPRQYLRGDHDSPRLAPADRPGRPGRRNVYGRLGGPCERGPGLPLPPHLREPVPLRDPVQAVRADEFRVGNPASIRHRSPGSYHHSLIVATMAEKAAEKIKLDPLLVKAGALYHDIGKIKMPEYFIENKDRKHDAHKDLAPSMSTLVIVNHVKEGVEIARKERLPEQVKEIIEQHHGNSIVRYFYQKAKEKSDPDIHTVGEESFRYPGPPPRPRKPPWSCSPTRSRPLPAASGFTRTSTWPGSSATSSTITSRTAKWTIAPSPSGRSGQSPSRSSPPSIPFSNRASSTRDSTSNPERARKNGDAASRPPHGRDHQPPDEEPHQD
ncbi:MAG: HDIG domain-containing protein [Sphingobacterium sp.]|nr:HDIG domain-containing protein [Sphingobacterium sp.]